MPESDSLNALPVDKENIRSKSDWLVVGPTINEAEPQKGFELYVVEDALRITEPNRQFNIRTILLTASNLKFCEDRLVHPSEGSPLAKEYPNFYLSDVPVDPIKVEKKTFLTTLGEGADSFKISTKGYYFYRHHLVEYSLYAQARDQLVAQTNQLCEAMGIHPIPSHDLTNAVTLNIVKD